MAGYAQRVDLLPGDVIPLPTARALNRREQSKAATRAKLIDAARFMFSNLGFFNVTIRALARRMGMSTGAVFAHVRDKDDLWRLAMDGPAPSLGLAEEVALVQSQRPDWRLILTVPARGDDPGQCHCVLQPPGYKAFDLDGPKLAAGVGSSPASAIRMARECADRMDGRFGDQPQPVAATA